MYITILLWYFRIKESQLKKQEFFHLLIAFWAIIIFLMAAIVFAFKYQFAKIFTRRTMLLKCRCSKYNNPLSATFLQVCIMPCAEFIFPISVFFIVVLLQESYFYLIL
jgi:hypothetical protein